MNYKGKDVRNVFHLRTPEDANSIARLANNKNAVIVGTSFVGEKKAHIQISFSFVLRTNVAQMIITCMFVCLLPGMEVAAALTDKAHSVSVIGIESVPFKKALGEKVGKAIMKVETRSWEIKLFRT